jgi:hypothetical protein
MSNRPVEICDSHDRRQEVRRREYNGIDYIEVSDDQRLINVYCFRKPPATIATQNVRIDGGVRIKSLRAVSVEIRGNGDDQSDYIQIGVDQPGDSSLYTLRLVEADAAGTPTDQPLAGFDVRYAQLDFSFKAGCPSDLDCKVEKLCPPAESPSPEINYLAKDYASFRQLVFDRLALTMPDWQERHVPDLGVAIVEILAYAADYLSYYQDAVATEAYLNTARQRISVRRHARLVDYRMHEGCNARAWIRIATDTDVTNPPLDPAKVFFLAAEERAQGRPATSALVPLENTAASAQAVFAPITTKPISLYASHTVIHFYTWGNRLCCLPAGSTKATLLDQIEFKGNGKSPASKPKHREAEPAKQQSTQSESTANHNSATPQPRILHLQKGDILIFEEVLGPKTANAADADRSHRHAVQLTSVHPSVDPLYGAQILEIEWAADDALPFDLCLSAIGPAPKCEYVPDISVARGNVLLVDHGRLLSDEPLGVVPIAATVEACEGLQHAAIRVSRPGPFRPTLKVPGLTFSQRLPHINSASTALPQEPRLATPWIRVTSIPPMPDGSAPLFRFEDLQDPTNLAIRLAKPSTPSTTQGEGAMLLRGQLSAKVRHQLDQYVTSSPPPLATPLPAAVASSLLAELQGLLRHWIPQPDLLDSHEQDRHYVVEMDDDRYAHLRFGDGDLGCAPEAGESFFATYRVGNPRSGNVGAEAITRLVFQNEVLSGAALQPTNPLPAQGETLPEPIEEVKMFAPGAFRKRLERAITADDYARLAEANAKVQRASATLSWTGSHYEVRVAIDPLGTEQTNRELLSQIAGHLYRYRRMGHDLMVVPAQYVSLDIAMTVCLLPDFLRGHVEGALLDVFSNRILPQGQRGFFHPDNLTFGTSVYLSQLVAAAQAVRGVESVTVTKLQRLFERPNGELESGVLPIGPLEVARLDNDPGFPERGTLRLEVRGGR